MRTINYKCNWLGDCVIDISEPDRLGRVIVTVKSDKIEATLSSLPGRVFDQNRFIWVPYVAQRLMPDRYFGENGEGYYTRVEHEKGSCPLCGSIVSIKGKIIKRTPPKEMYIDHDRMSKRDKKDNGIYYKEVTK